ncbi:MAG: putative glycoside hydrolase [Patescibacteria group bacterium]
MKQAAQFSIFILAGMGLFLFFNVKNDFKISNLAQLDLEIAVPERNIKIPSDLPPQKQLENPPEIIKAVYATGWTAGSEKGITRLIDLIKKTELNAIVIDIKDYSGNLSYYIGLDLAKKYKAEDEIKIAKPNAMIKKLHDEGIYVIARQTVFQDPILALARPDLALMSSSTGKQWKDHKGVMWIDAAAKDAWDYNIAIAKDALGRGFDEINFDYIRFSSDGNMNDINYPFWNEKTPKRQIMRSFFKYLRESLPDTRLSADMFGYVTILQDDLGIGQHLDDAFPYFNAIAPMVYPSHYNKGFLNHQNPADFPYEVVFASISEVNSRLKQYIAKAANSTSTVDYIVKNPQIRPWLQDFDMGATYDAAKVRAQIDATYASATGTPIGWMLWDPTNVYTSQALNLE